jgi:hypothetical protein
MKKHVEIIDNVISLDEREKIWNYIGNQTWRAMHEKKSPDTVFFKPNIDGWDYCEKNIKPNKYGCGTPRAPLARSESELIEKHKLIHDFWLKINEALGNKYELNGCPEGMGPTDYYPEWKIKEGDPSLPSWIVFVNGRPNEWVHRSYGVHRDNPDLNEEGAFNILYCANLEWYPTWSGELVFYSEDPEGNSGDTQQFQREANNQNRGFNVGWPSDIVANVPGRIVIYDSRTLHNTRPPSTVSQCMRVTLAFRARLKNEYTS